MNKVSGSGVHGCVIVILDWKTIAAIDVLILIRLLLR